MLLFPVFAATFVALLDLSIVAVALPEMQRDLSTDVTGAQWIVDGYALCLAALVLSGGALGDRYGRKRLFLGAFAVFVVGSLICAAADSLGVLLAGRAVQGVGAAVMMPGSISLLAQAIPDRGRRARVLGLQGMCNGGAIALGPIVGGALVDGPGWEWIFLINLPIGLAAIAIGMRSLPESADPDHTSLDPLGQALGACALGAVSYAIIESRNHGWEAPITLVGLAVGVAAGAAFVAVELRQPRPMLPIRLLADARFSIVNGASLALGFGGTGAIFLLSLYLQQARGHSALETGLMLLPLTLALVPASIAAGRLCARRDARQPMLAGFVLTGVALVGMIVLDADTPFLPMALLFALAGAGQGLAIIPAITVALESVPPERSGIGSATVGAFRQVGAALGIAVLGTILASQADDAGGFADGLQLAMLVAGATVLAAAVLLAVMPRRAPLALAAAGVPE